ncbi:MAG: flippase-like domain-containing protein [Prevotellaceae bacterium]|jgi:uncharacterized membrane protein YbhN (UPF0104 family)|nr:flippase-like domain-containing protein [Prevotellaceae bacterium]
MSTELKSLKGSRIMIPAVIGLIVVGYMFFKEFDPQIFDKLQFTWATVFWIFVALLCMAGRDFGYVVRMRVLSGGQLSWRASFRVIMLWEFTSAVTPSSVGGTSVALMYVHKEGISVGRSSSIVMTTSLLDEIYFVVMFPLLLALVGAGKLFDIPDSPAWTHGIAAVALIGYGIKLVWVMTLGYGLFFNPRGLSKLIFRIFHLPLLRRWKRGAARAASDIIISSAEMKSKRPRFWLKALLSTFLSWTSRYWVVNCLFIAFFAMDEHFLVFARQLVMWIALLVSPTPGGSGIAEFMFDKFLGEFIPIAGLSVALALLWRLVSYYPYLAIGALVVPKWFSDKFGKKNEI